MIIVLANYLGVEAGPADVAAVDPGRLPARRARRGSSSWPSRTSGRRSSCWRSSAACCSCPGRASSGSARSPSPVIAALPFVWNNVLRDYQQQRILGFLDPGRDIQGAGWQLHQSQIAVGSGGPFGKGLTNGTQNQLNFLPVQESDFVAAIYFEELGFVGRGPAAPALRRR